MQMMPEWTLGKPYTFKRPGDSEKSAFILRDRTLRTDRRLVLRFEYYIHPSRKGQQFEILADDPALYHYEEFYL